MWDANGWLLAVVCNDDEAYDAEFFNANGYRSVPKIGKVYVTYIGKSKNSGNKPKSFTYVLDDVFYEDVEDIELSREYYESDGSGEFFVMISQQLFVRLAENQMIVLRLSLSKILSGSI